MRNYGESVVNQAPAQIQPLSGENTLNTQLCLLLTQESMFWAGCRWQKLEGGLIRKWHFRNGLLGQETVLLCRK